MNIKDLKELIANLPDDMEIGGSGHYGEFLEVYDTMTRNVTIRKPIFGNQYNKETKLILCISMESAGDEPE